MSFNNHQKCLLIWIEKLVNGQGPDNVEHCQGVSCQGIGVRKDSFPWPKAL